MFAVLTCDIIDSKKTVKEKVLEEKLKEINNSYLNMNYLTDFNLSRGDEIQGVIKINKEFFEIIRQIKLFMYPYKLRMGISINKNEFDQKNEKNSWNLSGASFFEARDLLEAIGKSKEIKTKFSLEHAYLNSFYIFADMLHENWSEKSVEGILLMDRLKSLKEVAEKIGIRPQSVQDRLKSANYYKLIQAEEELLIYMEKKGGFDD